MKLTKCSVICLILIIGVFKKGNADCSDGGVSKIEEDMKQHEQSGTLCSNVKSLSDRILSYRDCPGIADLWHKLISDCPDGIKEADTGTPMQCRKENCMLTPDIEGNTTQPDDGNVDFGDLPTSLLKRLLGAFGTNPSERKKREATSSTGPKTLFDDDLRAIGNLIADNLAPSGDFDPISVCEILNELDIKRMLKCIIHQKTVLKCDGAAVDTQGYDVDSNAKKLSDICKRECLGIEPGPYRSCQFQKPYHLYLQSIRTAKESESGVAEACNDIQENYFDCFLNVSGCCEHLTTQLSDHYTNFMSDENGGQICTTTKLNKATNCDGTEVTTAAPDNENPDNDTPKDDNNDSQNSGDADPNVAPAAGGNGATGQTISLWMFFVLVWRCVCFVEF